MIFILLNPFAADILPKTFPKHLPAKHYKKCKRPAGTVAWRWCSSAPARFSAGSRPQVSAAAASAAHPGSPGWGSWPQA